MTSPMTASVSDTMVDITCLALRQSGRDPARRRYCRALQSTN
jgi:hypothetical protein